MNVPIEAITENARMREDYGDLTDLKESLENVGLLQAIGLRERGDLLEVIWGGRRLRAAKELGWTEIEARIMRCDEDYDMREMELEENIRRKDMTWQEQVGSLYEIHRLKKMRNAKVGEKWGFRETGKLLGVSLGNVAYSIEAAKYLRQGDTELKAAPTLTDAIRILTKRKEQELLKKKFASSDKTETANKFFSAKDVEEMKNVKASVENRVLYVKQDASAICQFMLTGPDQDPSQFATMQAHVHFWALHDPVDFANVSKWWERYEQCYVQHFLMQDMSAQNPALPLKDQFYVATLVAQQVPDGARNKVALFTGNNFVVRGGGAFPYALDPRFVQEALSLVIPKGAMVRIQTECPTYAFAAAIGGYKCVVLTEEMLQTSTNLLRQYGKIEDF